MTTDILSITSSIIGAVLFIYAIKIEMEIIGRLKQLKNPNKWKFAMGFTAFFTIGYIINILCIVMGWELAKEIFGALVFLFGAIFLVLVISISNKTYKAIFNAAEEELDHEHTL